jgi:hypothetical protein
MTPEEFFKSEQELALKVFNEDHEILPQFAILRSTGKVEQYVIVEGFGDGKQKEKYYALMKKYCRQPNVIACIQIMETWCSIGESRIPTVRPSEDPNRLSAIMIVLYTKTDEKEIMYLEKNGKLELFDIGEQGKFHSTQGNPFSPLDLKNRNFN